MRAVCLLFFVVIAYGGSVWAGSAPCPDDSKVLYYAARTGNVALVKNLLKCDNVDINVTVNHESALLAAALGLHASVVEVLIAQPDIEFGNAIHLSIRYHSSSEEAEEGDWRKDRTLRLLLTSEKANLDKAFDGKTPLVIASECGLDSVVWFLLQQGVDPHYISKYGTALHGAVRDAPIKHNMLATVALLIAAGANVNAVDEYGQTPLHELSALFQKDDVARANVVDILIQNRALVNAMNNFGKTPLDTAINLYDDAVEAALLKHGALTGDEVRRRQ